MHLRAILPIATILCSATIAFDSASAQIVEMTATRHYFQQLGRLAGSLNACSYQECPKRPQGCDGAEWSPFAPSGIVQNLAVDELKTCGASQSQINELESVFLAEVRSHELFACPLAFTEAREKYRAILRAIEERKRTGTTCVRRY
jgi:hypothetical protein